jgi:ribosome maturation factor RimP
VYLVDLAMKSENGRKIIEVFIDNDEGVTTDICAGVSRDLSRELDKHDIMNSRYHLIVSSPGLDKPLKYLRQYPRNIGKIISVKIKSDEKIVIIVGELIDVAENEIVLRVDEEKTQRLKYDSILETRVNIPW